MANNKATYSVVYRNVKNPRLEFKTGSLLVVLPKGDETPARTLEKHQRWIQEKQEIINYALKQAQNKNLDTIRTDEQLKLLAKHLAKTAQTTLNANVNRIFFKRMRSKWASNSKKNNLTINLLLKYLPADLVEYVIFHEVLHSLERKHNGYFWGIIAKRFPNYLTREKELLVYWFIVQCFLSRGF